MPQNITNTEIPIHFPNGIIPSNTKIPHNRPATKAIMNPPANTRLQANDILWLAGERKQILALFGEKKKVN